MCISVYLEGLERVCYVDVILWQVQKVMHNDVSTSLHGTHIDLITSVRAVSLKIMWKRCRRSEGSRKAAFHASPAHFFLSKRFLCFWAPQPELWVGREGVHWFEEVFAHVCLNTNYSWVLPHSLNSVATRLSARVLSVYCWTRSKFTIIFLLLPWIFYLSILMILLQLLRDSADPVNEVYLLHRWKAFPSQKTYWTYWMNWSISSHCLPATLI